MGMPTASIAQNPTNSAPLQSGGGKGMSNIAPPTAMQPMDQGARSSLQQPQSGGKGGSIQPSNMTISSTSGQPTTGQPNPYPNTTGSWDNSATQQPPAQMSGGKGKGA